MADFVSGDDDARESTSVLDDGYTVDFLEAFVNDTGSSDVSESWLGITEWSSSISRASTQEEQRKKQRGLLEYNKGKG